MNHDDDTTTDRTTKAERRATEAANKNRDIETIARLVQPYHEHGEDNPVYLERLYRA